MEVLKHGDNKKTSLPTSQKWFQKCYHCGCEYVYKNKDIVHDIREGDSWTHCPECRSTNDHKFQHYEDIVWFEQVKHHLNKLKEVTEKYSNPFMNDAGGSKDCQELNEFVTNKLKYYESIYC